MKNSIVRFDGNPLKPSQEMSQIVFDQVEVYDPSKEPCWSFRKKGDVRDGVTLNLGNMVSGYPFEMFGHHFKDSECAYIAGCYSQYGDENVRIQEELSHFNNGGYMAKRLYRNQDNENTRMIREDWELFNFHWMLLVLWMKTINNQEFGDLLLRIPLDAHIIEDTSYHHSRTSDIWGAKNPELTKIRKSRRKLTTQRLMDIGELTKTKIKKECQAEDNSINNVGVWIGKNVTGKCLKLCQLALVNNTIPPIDFDLLNSVVIHWFGSRLTF